LSYDSNSGNVFFNNTGIDLSTNEGAALINDLVQSNSTYDLGLGTDVETAQGLLQIDNIENLDNLNSHAPINDPYSPKGGVDDQIAVNNLVRGTSRTHLLPASTDSVVFHELAAAYAKVDHHEAYTAAHQEAIRREDNLRDERPYLKSQNPGSGELRGFSGPAGGHQQYQQETIIKK
jgi:hypothetical protein